MTTELATIVLTVIAVLLTQEGLKQLAKCRAAWADRKVQEEHVEQWKNRRKCEITKVGKIVYCECGCGTPDPVGFEFKGHPRVPPFWISPDGEPALPGWTIAELTEVAQRRKEFES